MTAKPTPAPAAAATHPNPLTAVTVELLQPPAADDPNLVEHIAALINSVYAAAERGLWRDHAQRITVAELAQHIRSGEVAVARAREEIVGSVRVWDVGHGRSEFGLLVTAPEHRGLGVGSALVTFAEGHSRDQGGQAIRLELLLPRGWTHPDKQLLDAWYRRIGYRAVSTASVTSVYPRLAPQLACPCDFVVYEKPLGQRSSPAKEAQLMRMIHGYRTSQIVATLAHLAITDQLANGPASSDELAEAVRADPDALLRLLRAATSIGLLEETERHRFAVTPLGALLRSDAAGSLRDAAIAIAGPGQYRPWERPHDVVRTGRSHTQDALGSDLWDYYRQRPDEASRSARTMSWISDSGLDELLASYDTSRFRPHHRCRRGSGELLGRMLAHNPGAEGVLFELPPVIDGAGKAPHIGQLDGRVRRRRHP